MKLQVGTVILVHGWVMMSGLDAGCRYRVHSITQYHGLDTYRFTRPKGKKIVIRHYTDSVDSWVREAGHPDLNRIEIVTA